jgi:transposase
MYEYGTWKIFSEVCLHAFRNFGVDCSVVHQDTTSVSVWGEYKPAPRDPFRIVHGFSKDKRPDLKQFILSLLCVEGNLPCHAGILDGNAADKKTHGKILAELPRIMARHGVGQQGFIYVADSAFGHGGEPLSSGGRYSFHYPVAGELRRLWEIGRQSCCFR